ncbi:conjugative transfer ATPase [Azotobacter vinelandii]|uniref:conjugative transfer ATPase n=1 Tax=Azotobacter vinelandii TaxID=354 RepID=UPI000B1EF796|nr:conjugative transfer ATPase [Azotobacter vinelandii]
MASFNRLMTRLFPPKLAASAPQDLEALAARMASALPGDGFGDTGRIFARCLVDVIWQAHAAVGFECSPEAILSSVTDIERLFLRYASDCLSSPHIGLDEARRVELDALEDRLDAGEIEWPKNLIGRDRRVVALVLYLQSPEAVAGGLGVDPVLKGLLSVMRYDKAYYDTIVASLWPTLERLARDDLSGPPRLPDSPASPADSEPAAALAAGQRSPDETDEQGEDLGALAVDETGERLVLPRGKPVSMADLRKSYERAPSFASRLPWVEFLPESGCILLEDGMSVGLVAEVVPISTEGRSPEALESVRDQIESAFQDSIPEMDDFPYVLQLYVSDDTNPREDLERIKRYIDPTLLETAYTQQWLASMADHLRAISRPGGLFFDEVVTQTEWRGRTRRTRLVLYRWLPSERLKKGKTLIGESRRQLNPEKALNHVFDRLTGALRSSGLRLRRYTADDFHNWMMPWFNPRPRLSPDDPRRFYDRFRYPEKPSWSYDLSEGLLASSPKGDAETGIWYFDGMPHAVVPVEELRSPPAIGHLTGELPRNDRHVRNAMFDLLPEGTVTCLTMVATPQEPLENHISTLRKKAVGDSVLAAAVRHDCDQARDMLTEKHKLYQSALCFFVKGEDDDDLQSRLLDLTTQLINANLKPTDPEDEVAALNTYLRWLPMNFQPELDRKNRWYTQYNFVQHLANLAPLFGRARGTGHPGITLFNRGGETLDFDPLNLSDRQANAHMLIFGPTGAGKSASLNGILGQVMAVRRPRLFVIEKGNSFGLLGQYFERYGLTVNRVRLAPGSGVCLPPFAESHRLLQKDELLRKALADIDDATSFTEQPAAIELEEEDKEERNILGEMEITARLMITGGDPKEEALFRRSDQRLVRDAIFIAARKCAEEQRQCLTEDIRAAFQQIANAPDVPPPGRERAYSMGESMALYVDGFDGEVFNRPGTPWPECDVTIIDLAHYADGGYSAQLALAIISITNVITAMAERDQYSGRPIVQVIDEAHLLTTNPLLAPFLVSVGKMGRKLSHWLWLATQNLEDFPDTAAKLLNMIEWWVLLTMPPDEVAKVMRFKELTEERRKLVLSATKEQRKYTEGVVLGGRLESLFRVVPPSLYLALAGTEGEEKAERARIMAELNCSELDAAIEAARRLDKKRGISA